MIKRFLPRSLLGRSVLIIVTPLILLQVVSAAVFWENHWDKVSVRLARNLAGDISALILLLREQDAPPGRNNTVGMAAQTMGLNINMRPGEILANAPAKVPSGFIESVLFEALDDVVTRPFVIDMEAVDRHVLVSIQLQDGVLDITANRKRLFSSTTYVFVMWMVGTSLILFAVAIMFMRNQVRPIRRLATAADSFGKGRDAPNFKPEGAAEVRRAASAFIAMRDRIQRNIAQRTDMLSSVSHDLRTPLTRMKLQLAMLKDSQAAEDLKEDVSEMEHMLEGYLAFARGEGDEAPELTDIGGMLDEVVGQSRRNGAAVDLHTEGEIQVAVRPNAFKRCVTNLVENAGRYGEHVSVRAGQRGETIEITIDDDGPGIPEDQRSDAFKPFFRLDNSRNIDTGGVGLGLSIARDVIRGHGGDIDLDQSPAGGLRARVILPI